MHALQIDFVMNRQSFYDFENCIDDCALYLCEIFCDHHFVNALFMFYFLIICHEIHVKLAHINFFWIEMIIYRVTLNEMFVCNSLIHARMHARIWRNVWNLLVTYLFLFTCSDFDEMFATTFISQFAIVFACSWFDFFVCLVRTKCHDSWFISRFRFVALHEKIYMSFDETFATIYMSRSLRSHRILSCLYAQILNRTCMLESYSMFNRSSRLLDSITYVLKCFSSKCSIRCVSHRKSDQKSSCLTKNAFFLFSRNVQAVRVS